MQSIRSIQVDRLVRACNFPRYLFTPLKRFFFPSGPSLYSFVCIVFDVLVVAASVCVYIYVYASSLFFQPSLKLHRNFDQSISRTSCVRASVFFFFLPSTRGFLSPHSLLFEAAVDIYIRARLPLVPLYEMNFQEKNGLMLRPQCNNLSLINNRAHVTRGLYSVRENLAHNTVSRAIMDHVCAHCYAVVLTASLTQMHC